MISHAFGKSMQGAPDHGLMRHPPNVTDIGHSRSAQDRADALQQASPASSRCAYSTLSVSFLAGRLTISDGLLWVDCGSSMAAHERLNQIIKLTPAATRLLRGPSMA